MRTGHPSTIPATPLPIHRTAGLGGTDPAAVSEAARAHCARLVARHHENFPVGSWLVPRDLRPAIRAVYAFARTADDFADEPAHRDERLARLDAWERDLIACFAGRPAGPIFTALHSAVSRHDLPQRPFLDLLEAFRMDAEERRHPDFASLLGYCRLSANPIGRLILHLFGYRDPLRIRLSDAVCTGLQLANHWQDVAVDFGRGRLYLPQEDLDRHGVTEGDLAAARVDQRFRSLMREQVDRARGFFLEGRGLPAEVRGRLRAELRLTWLGGWRILDRIETAGYDVFRRRPRLGPRDACVISWRALTWRS
jgi:squalene synthase HpnC